MQEMPRKCMALYLVSGSNFRCAGPSLAGKCQTNATTLIILCVSWFDCY